MLDRVLSFKREAKKFKNQIVEYNLCLIAHNGSRVDGCVVLNNLPQWRNVLKLIEDGAGTFSLELPFM